MYNDPSIEQTSVFEEFGPQLTYASVGQRFANFLIDSLVCYGLNYLAGIGLVAILLLTDMSRYELVDYVHSISFTLLSLCISLVVNFLYYTLVEAMSKGRTLGKIITGTMAVQENGQKITWKNACLRTLCRFIPFEPFSAFNSHPWHDTITKTAVVKTR